VSGLRREYFRDVLGDALAVCKELGVDPDDQGQVIAALIQSDSLNGIRKALLTPNYFVPRSVAGRDPAPVQY